jgi:preprotein translocase subunit SecG
MDQLTVYLAAAAFTLAVALGKVWSKEQRRKAAESEKQLWQEERHDE